MESLAQEMRFEQQLLDEIIGDKQQYPGVICEDNIGAIFLAQNKQVGHRTKHIDVRDHYIKGLIDERKLKINFTRSENNYTDILTKNVTKELFIKHTKQIDQGRLKYETTPGKVMTMEDKNDLSDEEEKHLRYSVRSNNDERDQIQDSEESGQNEAISHATLANENENGEGEDSEGYDDESNVRQEGDIDSEWPGIMNREFQEVIDKGYASPNEVKLESRYIIARRPQLDEENSEMFLRMYAQGDLQRRMREVTISNEEVADWERAASLKEERLMRSGNWGVNALPAWEVTIRRYNEGVHEAEGSDDVNNEVDFTREVNETLERSDLAVASTMLEETR